MRAIIAAALVSLVGISAAAAHDTSPDACQVEDWRWWAAPGDILMVEGAATCTDGTMQLRLYAVTETGRNFLGATTSYIEGHIFESFFMDINNPTELSIEYVITEGEAW